MKAHMFILNFIIGLVIVVAGVAAIRFNYQLVNAFGRNNIFERKLGPGSTYPAFLVGGVLVIIGGFLVMFSLHDTILDIVLGPLIDVFSPDN